MNSVGGVIGLPITNHFSPITSHGRASGLAVRFQDLLLAFSRRFAFGVWHLVLVLVLYPGPWNRINPFRYIAITASLFVMFVLLGLG